jgi:hypothetical protein
MLHDIVGGTTWALVLHDTGTTWAQHSGGRTWALMLHDKWARHGHDMGMTDPYHAEAMRVTHFADGGGMSVWAILEPCVLVTPPPCCNQLTRPTYTTLGAARQYGMSRPSCTLIASPVISNLIHPPRPSPREHCCNSALSPCTCSKV